MLIYKLFRKEKYFDSIRVFDLSIRFNHKIFILIKDL